MADSNSSDTSGHSAATDLHEAILMVLLYADIFDYPLSAREVFQYLNVPADPEQVQASLATAVQRGRLAQSGPFYSLSERPDLAAVRTRRGEVSQRAWPRARLYARLIASLPFVEMVAVTGALAMDNVEPDADMDFMIVCAPGHVWLVRALTGAIRRLALLAGDRICPNYILGSNALALDQHNLYAARELFQMIPLYGLEVYRSLLAANPWAVDYLPNAAQREPATNGHRPVIGLIRLLRRTLEFGLGGRLGRRIQEAEWRRWQRMLARQVHVGPEVVLSPDRFKMHDLGHGGRILAVYAERLARYGLSFPDGRRTPALERSEGMDNGRPTSTVVGRPSSVVGPIPENASL